MNLDLNDPPTDDVTDELAVVTGPGHNLRLAREAAGLSCEEVSVHLRLRVELIRALEQDDYANLPPLAYVSGYLRNYARLLDLPVDNLLDQLEQHNQSSMKVASIMPRQQTRSSDWLVKLVTWLIVLLLLALLGIWWLTHQPVDNVAAGTASLSAAAGLAEGLQHVEPEQESIEPEQESPMADEPMPDFVKDNLQQQTAEQPASVETASVDSIKPAQQVVVTPAPVINDEPVRMGEKISSVQLTAIDGESWMEVSDADGNQLAYEMLSAGTSRTLHGKAPFSVFLGNAAVVKVRYQNKLFDHSAFRRRGDVAKFSLGKDADNKIMIE
ncbi:MAG: RodZ domain-containing protein [Thiohalomonadaceae bacterium]